jgi:hypothetical protein
VVRRAFRGSRVCGGSIGTALSVPTNAPKAFLCHRSCLRVSSSPDALSASYSPPSRAQTSSSDRGGQKTSDQPGQKRAVRRGRLHPRR